MGCNSLEVMGFSTKVEEAIPQLEPLSADLSLKKGRGSNRGKGRGGTKGGPEMVRRKGESENN